MPASEEWRLLWSSAEGFMEESSTRTPPQEPDLDGQLGPDEISDPDEVRKSNEAKLHHEGAEPNHSEGEGADESGG